MPPAVVSMTPFFIEELRRIRNTTGVAYEIPGVTAFVKLRSVIARPLRKVAVVHRPRFRQFIDRQRRLAAKEDIELQPLEVGADPTAAEVRAALAVARESGRRRPLGAQRPAAAQEHHASSTRSGGRRSTCSASR